ncbi:MAG: hypothetical protein PUG16_06405 [Lachnospiraceae bacterium]|nr:hypothetical protein [Lachnospiraceae bacterium]
MSLGIAGYANAEYSLNKVQKKETDEVRKSNGQFGSLIKKTGEETLPSSMDVYVRSADSKEQFRPVEEKKEGSGQGQEKQNASSDKNQSIAADVNNTSARDVLKMSAADRADLVSRLEEEQEAQQQQFIQMVRKSLGYQASAYENANAQPSVDNNGIWHFLASGNYTVDAATKAEAEASIAEDGYFGVKNTAQRLFDFAAALAGDDPDKMKAMQAGIAQGFQEAEDAWGKELPDISKKTLDAANQLFQNYYDSKTADNTDTEEIQEAAV